MLLLINQQLSSNEQDNNYYIRILAGYISPKHTAIEFNVDKGVNFTHLKVFLMPYPNIRSLKIFQNYSNCDLNQFINFLHSLRLNYFELEDCQSNFLEIDPRDLINLLPRGDYKIIRLWKPESINIFDYNQINLTWITTPDIF